jgi:hypothetical protein
MKTLLLALVSFVMAATAFAQSKKPVDVIRYKLQEGKRPFVEQLKLGKSWSCKVYSAGTESRYLDEVEDVFRFEKYSDMIVNLSEDAVAVRDFVFHGKSLTGQTESGIKGVYNIRVAQNGDLVVEAIRRVYQYSVRPSVYLAPEFMRIFSIPVTEKIKVYSQTDVNQRQHYDGLYAYVYLICPVSKVK